MCNSIRFETGPNLLPVLKVVTRTLQLRVDIIVAKHVTYSVCLWSSFAANPKTLSENWKGFFPQSRQLLLEMHTLFDNNVY